MFCQIHSVCFFLFFYYTFSSSNICLVKVLVWCLNIFHTWMSYSLIDGLVQMLELLFVSLTRSEWWMCASLIHSTAGSCGSDWEKVYEDDLMRNPLNHFHTNHSWIYMTVEWSATLRWCFVCSCIWYDGHIHRAS